MEFLGVLVMEAPLWCQCLLHKVVCRASHLLQALGSISLCCLLQKVACSAPHLLQALGNKVMEGEGPSVSVCQAGRRVPGDHEDDPHGVHRPTRRGHFRHLHCTDAQSPHIHLNHNPLLTSLVLLLHHCSIVGLGLLLLVCVYAYVIPHLDRSH